MEGLDSRISCMWVSVHTGGSVNKITVIERRLAYRQGPKEMIEVIAIYDLSSKYVQSVQQLEQSLGLS